MNLKIIRCYGKKFRKEKYYGKEIFYEDAFNEVVPEELEKAVEENKLEVVSRPKIDIVQMEKGKDLIFTAIVDVKPEVKLGKYKGISIEKTEYKNKNNSENTVIEFIENSLR